MSVLKIMLNFSFLSLQICCRIDMGGKAEAPPLFFYRFRLSINLAIASIIAATANNSFVIALISLNRFLFLLISATSFLYFNYNKLSSFYQSLSIDYGEKITATQIYFLNSRFLLH